jgi:virginiamycin B lyase
LSVQPLSRAGLLVAIVCASGLGCNAVLGITDLPGLGLDAGATESGFESGSEASTDATVEGSTGNESGAEGAVESGGFDASDAPATDAPPDVASGCPLADAAVGQIVEYPIPLFDGVAGNQSQPDGIALGPDGNLWFTESAAHAIGRITPGGIITPLSITPAGPLGIVQGPQGAVWFVATSGSLGYVVTTGPATPVPNTMPIPNGANGSPRRIAVGPDGNLWFTLFSTNMIGTYNPADGGFVEYPVPTANAEPDGITAGPGDGKLWFTEEGGNQIGAIATDGTVREYPIPTAGAKAQGITVGPDGALWFTEQTPSKIGHITTSGVVVEYPVANGSGPVHIASDGQAVWFTETGANAIGRIAPDGGVTEYHAPTAGAIPADIAIGPCGSVWFPEYNAGQIGVLTP